LNGVTLQFAHVAMDVPYTKAALCFVMNSSMFIACVPVSSPIQTVRHLEDAFLEVRHGRLAVGFEMVVIARAE